MKKSQKNTIQNIVPSKIKVLTIFFSNKIGWFLDAGDYFVHKYNYNAVFKKGNFEDVKIHKEVWYED